MMSCLGLGLDQGLRKGVADVVEGKADREDLHLTIQMMIGQRHALILPRVVIPAMTLV